jgi:hypothetical protein
MPPGLSFNSHGDREILAGPLFSLSSESPVIPSTQRWATSVGKVGPSLSSDRLANLNVKKHTKQSYPLIRSKTLHPEDPTPHNASCSSISSNSSSCCEVSGPTNPDVFALPTHRLSLESPKTTGSLSYCDIVSRLQSLLKGTSDSREMSFEGVSSDVVEKLRENSGASELSGWENLR